MQQEDAPATLRVLFRVVASVTCNVLPKVTTLKHLVQQEDAPTTLRVLFRVVASVTCNVLEVTTPEASSAAREDAPATLECSSELSHPLLVMY